jgi:hypothetical protein
MLKRKWKTFGLRALLLKINVLLIQNNCLFTKIAAKTVSMPPEPVFYDLPSGINVLQCCKVRNHDYNKTCLIGNQCSAFNPEERRQH